MGHPAANVIKVTKPVPSELAQFMQYVWYYGIEGHEQWAESVSDDLIQAPNVAPVIGGLCDKKAKRFFSPIVRRTLQERIGVFICLRMRSKILPKAMSAIWFSGNVATMDAMIFIRTAPASVAATHVQRPEQLKL